MAKVIKQKVLRKGTKDDRSALGSREYLTRNEIEERYPICSEAQMIIDVLSKGLDKSSVYHLTESLRGFCAEVQLTMAEFLIDEYYYRISGEGKPKFTGLFFVDRLLVDLLYLFDHDNKNITDEDLTIETSLVPN